ncbi:beta strand repeat-containing protein [Leptospira sp. WS4.C2]
MRPAKIFRNAILIPLFLFQACIPSLSKDLIQSVSDFIQLRSLVNTGPFKISVIVSGLLGSGLTIDLNSGVESIVVNSNGSYEFATTLTTGNNFTVSIKTQPTLPVQSCSVSGGVGVVGFGDINSIIVNCDPLRYTIGGTITGLDGITGLGLTNSVDGSTLNVAVASGAFAFTQTYLDGTTYNISVTTQPNHPVQDCVITNGSGTIASANITNITIACTSTAFPIEVTAVGIASGTLTIRNNNSELLTISTNGLHRFPTNIITNNTYSLQIMSTPANHQCTLDLTSGTVTGTISVKANCFSVLSFSPSNGGILQPLESLRLQFSDAINAGSCTGSTGTLNTNASLPIQFSVTTTSLPNDTLIVSPAPTDSWMSGHRTLTLSCFNVGGTPLSSTVNLLYLIPSALRFVADTTGNDLNDGLTPFTPKRHIQSAINSFGGCPSSDCAVLVEAGSYDPTFVGGTIQLVSGISLYGSYVAGSSFGTWNPDVHSSVILMDTTPPGCSIATVTSPCTSIFGDATVTNNVTISGFRIESGPDIAPYMAGVFLDSTNNVRLINNEINAGTGINGSSGVHAINSNPYLIKTTIVGGLCSTIGCEANGLYISSATALAPVLLGNTIAGGNLSFQNSKSKGIYYAGSSGMDMTNVRGNIIYAGSVDMSTSTTSESIALDINAGTSSTGILAGNVIGSSNGYKSMGIRITPSSNIQIGSPTQGNLISSGNAIYESFGISLGGGQIIRRNQIQTGNTTNLSAFTSNTGILISSGGTATIENNSIVVGNANSTTATGTAIGIRAVSLNAASNITGNYIRVGSASGGTATLVSGIQLASPGAMLLANNWIQNGTSAALARGIDLSAVTSAIRIYHNTSNSGTGTVGNETPVYLNIASSLADIQNNIFLLNNNTGNNACIILAGPGAQTAIKYNVLFNCTNLVRQNATFNYTDLCGTGIPTTVGCITPLGIVGNFGNNLNLNPNFVSNFAPVAVYTPTTATSCLITKSTNAISTNSYNGAGTRPGSDGAISLGAVEYDYACTP